MSELTLGDGNILWKKIHGNSGNFDSAGGAFSKHFCLTFTANYLRSGLQNDAVLDA